MIDDLKAGEVFRGHGGISILFENPNIRKMLRLANAGENDIFCDMGCGIGQNLIIAATEFHVKKAIGFEMNEKRFKRAVGRIRRRGLEDKRTVFHEKYERLLEGKSQFKLEDATIVFFGLDTRTVLSDLEKRLSEKSRLVYYNLCLFPEIMPDRKDFPFLVSQFPFTKTTSELSWLRAIVCKERSTMIDTEPPVTAELWDELSHDYKVASNDPVGQIRNYKKRMQRLLAP